MGGARSKPHLRYGRWSIFLVVAGLVAVILLCTDYPLRAEISLIHTYREHVSPTLSSTIHCRFHPSCSQYALQVLPREGFWKGNLFVGLRLIHCSPIGMLWDYGQKVLAG